jgi:hypothetical protein
VVTGELTAWKARRVADATLHLSKQAAGFVDRHVAPVARLSCRICGWLGAP